MTRSRTVKEDKKKGKKRLILLLLLLFAIVAGGTFIWTNTRPTAIASNGMPDVTAAEKMTPDQLKDYANKKVDESNVTINVYPDINVGTDGTTGNMWIQNLPTNKVGQQAILVDDQTGEKLFSSGLIKPGFEITKVSLDKKLVKGDHNATIHLEFYDLKTEKRIGETAVDVTVHVS